MTANERRAEIIRILTGRRFETIPNLAAQLDVSRPTVARDILTLTLDYPIETIQGKRGGVRLMKDYHTYRNDISQEQQEWLLSLIPISDKHGTKMIKEILVAHGSVRNRELIECY